MTRFLILFASLALSTIPVPAWADVDAGNPFISDAGCSTDDECAEGEACNSFGECEFFDAVVDMGHDDDHDHDDAGTTDAGDASTTGGEKGDPGCSTTSGSAAPAGLLLFGLIALRGRRRARA